jgi:fibronectin-binding autotransporter adhesin
MQSSPAFAKSAKGSDVSWRIQGMACRAVAGLALWLGLGELPQSAQAATIVWENTGTAFATGGNWVGGTAPANDTTTDIGSFQSATVSFNPQLTGSRSIAGLVFTSGTGAWTFTGNSGTRVLTLGAAGITNNSSNTQTFSGGALRLSLGANSTFDGETGSLAFAANMAGLYLNSYNLTLDGSSTTNTIAEAMSGTGGSITKVGSGTWTLSGANTYTGATNIGTAGGANAGTLVLAGNNAYTGATNVTSGAVKVTHNSGLAGSGATVTSGAALQFAQDAGGNNINAVAVNATIAGTGLANGGAIQNLNGTNSYAGAITLSADARITANSGSALTLSGNVNGAGYDLEAGGQGNTTYSGVISGTGTTFTKTDSGTVTFSGAGANTFTGALTVNEGTLNLNKTAGVNAVGTSNTVIIGDTVGAASSANLVLQANNQMPNTTDVTINSDGRLAMGTFSDEISQLAGTGLLDLGTTGLLTIGGDNSSSVFDGTITGTGTLEKSGTGSLTFNSDISYDGTLELGGGTLVLNDMLLSEVDPENWTGPRIVRPNSGERFQCRRRDEYTVPSLKPKLGLML